LGDPVEFSNFSPFGKGEGRGISHQGIHLPFAFRQFYHYERGRDRSIRRGGLHLIVDFSRQKIEN
jgi:hypothetical protein